MKYVEEYRDGKLAREIAERIRQEAQPTREYNLMEFCGGHTHAIFRYGIPDLLPDNVNMIHGPGCPVCVLPISRLDMAIELAVSHGVILCSYGDMMRVPGSRKRNLLKARAAGADVRMVYSCMDALKLAQDNPDREVVFFAIGFETTTPPTALVIHQAKKLGLTNFTVFCNHVLTPAAISSILDSPEAGELGLLSLDGFVGPAHVSTVIGSQPYERFATDYNKSIVIAGFEPLDLLQAILMLIRQLNDGRAEVENEFSRAVSREGNERAKDIVDKTFAMRDAFEWRGLGLVPHSALKIRPEFSQFDAEIRFPVEYRSSAENSACECGAILHGVKSPRDCTLFGGACTPENPLGPCMVSSEGACAAYYSYGRHQESLINTASVE
ncbi:hydrogenase formation protein HypD [Amphritea sp. 2_MG-2023]|uniref:hydrogenase formation protein HypD n=1 Tax=Amphritea TaxID=515417 RepID=UPI001C072655|nr:MULTISPECIES: hydrogenase formation protein HypD [Amphritea]MBU2965866.1 hydrogenase formation protein HypD [Amphritea atlantica]MDO6417955.1 hydrogenase formation protein HypD [Amphritea sp. 2_MG-2023]